MMTNEEKFERLGKLIDSLDSIACALSLPFPAENHVEQLKIFLPEKVIKLKQVYEEITGENIWE